MGSLNHSWSVAEAGEELSLLTRPGITGLNFTAELAVNGTRITCTSEQRNTYTQVNITHLFLSDYSLASGSFCRS